MSGKPARAVDLDALPTDVSVLDDLSEESLVQWFVRAEAGSTTRFLWQCAFVDSFHRRYGEPGRGWYTIAAEKLRKDRSLIHRLLRVWRLYEHFVERGIPSEIEAFTSLSPMLLEQFGRVPGKTRVEAARFAFKLVAQQGEPTASGFQQALIQEGLFPRQVPEKAEVGKPLNFRGLVYEPINEDGVVFLFGMIAGELGFVVESIQKGFPDCAARQRKERGRYVPVSIEFEFNSSAFRAHRHDESRCDLIVCWEDDWPDCPIQVLELKSAIQTLDPNVRV